MAWSLDERVVTVFSYFERGAYQRTWTFVSDGFGLLRFTRAPACRGVLRVMGGAKNGTDYEVHTDAP